MRPSYVALRKLRAALALTFALALLLTAQRADAAEPTEPTEPTDPGELTSARVDYSSPARPLLRDRPDGTPTLRVPRAARVWLAVGGASTLLGGALATLALTTPGRTAAMPRDLVTGVSAPQTGPWVAAGLGGLLGGHLLTQVGVRVAKQRHAALGRHFVLRTQLGLTPRSFTIGIGGRF